MSMIMIRELQGYSENGGLTATGCVRGLHHHHACSNKTYLVCQRQGVDSRRCRQPAMMALPVADGKLWRSNVGPLLALSQAFTTLYGLHSSNNYNRRFGKQAWSQEHYYYYVLWTNTLN